MALYLPGSVPANESQTSTPPRCRRRCSLPRTARASTGLPWPAATSDSVDRFLLMDSVTFDSWPVPAVERFRNPGVRASMGVNEMVAARAETTRKAVGRTLSEDEVADYVSPWKDPAS